MTRLLQHAISTRAQQRPDARALVQSGRTLSYGQLEAQSNQLARTLIEAGRQPGDRVAILAPKTPEAIVAILAALKADCVYVPMDSASPPSRLAKIIGSSRPRWILAVAGCGALLDGMLADSEPHPAPRVLSLDENEVPGERFTCETTRGGWSTASSDAVSSRRREDDAAHLLFTSGSTGMPKGVVITHRNVLSFIDWAQRHFGFDSSDRHSCHPPLHFDLSTFDVFGTLSAGAELHLVPTEANLIPQKLIDMIRDEELTQWFSVPSILNYLAKFDAVNPGDLPSLKRILWCGEVFPTPSLIYWMERVPHARFTNLYGPTETTIASTFYDVETVPTDPAEPIPIGRPCDGEEVLILDDSLREVPSGEVGNLFIRGVGLSPGYWEDPEKTASVFRENPYAPEPGDRIYKTGDLARLDSDGLLHFVGRADTQIKSRGYRIELGEIEAALHALPAIDESAVVALPTDGFEGHMLCCAYSLKEGAEAPPAALRKELGRTLPGYMLPMQWLCLERLPKNVNGKIDRPELKDRFADRLKTSRAGGR